MLDVYRFILALFVVQGHLLAWGSHWLAWQAVFSFYVLSGFLMTLVLNQGYGFTVSGIARFAANRGLRLFPIYWIVVGLTALHIAFVGPLDQLNRAILMPVTADEQSANLFIVGLVGLSRRLSPSAWSIAVELFCYMLLALLFAKSSARLFVMLAIGLWFTVPQLFSGFNQKDFGFPLHYNNYQGGLIPFAIGGLAYFYRHSRLFAFSRTKLAVLCLALFLNFIAGYWSEFHKYVGGLYVAIALNLMMVPMLFSESPAPKWQALLGSLSYPLFLSHWAIGTLVTIYLPVAPLSFINFIIGAVASIAFSLLLHFCVDRHVQKLRSLVKLSRLRARQPRLQ